MPAAGELEWHTRSPFEGSEGEEEGQQEVLGGGEKKFRGASSSGRAHAYLPRRLACASCAWAARPAVSRRSSRGRLPEPARARLRLLPRSSAWAAGTHARAAPVPPACAPPAALLASACRGLRQRCTSTAHRAPGLRIRAPPEPTRAPPTCCTRPARSSRWRPCLAHPQLPATPALWPLSAAAQHQRRTSRARVLLDPAPVEEEKERSGRGIRLEAGEK
jgi:hypothetical protein